jgi:copper(I)-binding protein
MRRVQEMVVPAAQVLALEPGGQHLMLIDLKQPLAAGATLTLTLSFADGSARTVLAAVR